MLAAALAGALLFTWIAGARLIDPREVGWTMRLDWQWHYLGWHMFRHEPWQFPPARLGGEFYPVGTSIAYTDSVPIAALVLKPWSRWLPDPFQYLGAWLLLCYALQGACGAMVAGCVTGRPLPRALTGSLLATSPVLLDRVGHVALCSHFLILLGFWLYGRRWAQGPGARIASWAALVAAAAFVHPYLWLMVVALSAAAAVRYAVDREYSPRETLGHMAATLISSGLSGWLLGWFIIGGGADLGAEGLGTYSMNLLGLFASNGMSSIVGRVPVFAGQTYEGLNYLGAGSFALIAVAAVTLIRRPLSPPTLRALWPIAVACAALAVLSLSPRITIGQTVLVDLPLPRAVASLWSVFRATGRLFWPAGYLLTVGAALIVIARTRPAVASTLLAGAIVLQLVDLRGRYVQARAARSEAPFYEWTDLTRDSELVRTAAPRKHLVVLPTLFCGAEPVPYAPILAFAGSRGLTVNTGYAARVDASRLREVCARDMAAARAGDLRRDTIYIASADLAAQLKRAAHEAVSCSPLLGAFHCEVDAHR
jgi:Family of unknown function (DUF6311)